MAKPGERYQQVVAALVQALDPNSAVRMGQWIEGPDGEREVDVEIRGNIDDKAHFTLVECKDWKRPVDIQEIDKLVSKSADLRADLAILYSNSGFTRQAIRKATRLGIELASALELGNTAIRLQLSHHALGKLIELHTPQLYLQVNTRNLPQFPSGTDLSRLSLAGLWVARWVQEEVRSLVIDKEESGSFRLRYSFFAPPPFTSEGIPASIAGFVLLVGWNVKWLSQIIQAEVTQASFDHIRKRTMMPGAAVFTLGPIDTHASGWNELSARPEDWSAKPLPRGLSLRFHFLKGFSGSYEPHEVPDVGRYVAHREIEQLSPVVDQCQPMVVSALTEAGIGRVIDPTTPI